MNALNKSLTELSLDEISEINGGSKKDTDFGYKVGRDISRAANYVWRHTIGCTPAY
ncbi:hypothetical protein [Clostridium weizhouense]|uniref:Bacteriocin n=1 Tax=Clostridium weizhouense TaxID=2859781 RepID=A0ABS7AQ10_9CLOT|nr:hypothetical protein [Clostridium weizhouense]MBW6410752.1 hypothetical protein [Clostridium weizhouense]